jgi:hypothetical protein
MKKVHKANEFRCDVAVSEPQRVVLLNMYDNQSLPLYLCDYKQF